MKPNYSSPGIAASLYRRRAMILGVLAGATACTMWTVRIVLACGGTPPPPVCGKSVAIAKAVPGVVLIPPGVGGIVVPIPTTVTLGLTEVPPGSGVCPPPPFMCTVTITIACVPPPSPPVASVTIPIVPGPNPIVVPVFIPFGPPRVCTVTGTATVMFTDGSVISATGDAEICIVRPAPDDPGLPEVDMQVLGPEQQRVHPGVTAWYDIGIKNNHPTLSVTGTLTGDTINSSRMPTSSGNPPGSGPYAFSDPDPDRLRDNFDIGFWDEASLCIPTRPNFSDPFLPTVSRDITLAPGESTVVTIGVKPAGTCSDGSCSEGTAHFEYVRSDSVAGVSCVGYTTMADSTAPAIYECGDSGRATNMVPKGPLVIVAGRPTPAPTSQYQVPIELVSLQLTSGVPIPVQSQTFSSPLGNNMRPTNDYARQQTLVQRAGGGPLFAVNSFFDVFYTVHLPPSAGVTPVVQNWMFMPNAPTGFQNLSPFAKGMVDIHTPSGMSLLMLVQQVNVSALLSTGQSRRMLIQQVLAQPIPSGVQVRLIGQIEPGPAAQVLALNMENDWRGYASSPTAPQFGACCMPYGDCAQRTQSACLSKGGVFRGVGTPCDVPCPTPQVDVELLDLQLCNVSNNEADLLATVGIRGGDPTGLDIDTVATIATGSGITRDSHILSWGAVPAGITCNKGAAPPCSGTCPNRTATFKNNDYSVPGNCAELQPANRCLCVWLVLTAKRVALPQGSGVPHTISFHLDPDNLLAEMDELNNRRTVVHTPSTPACSNCGVCGDSNCNGSTSVGDIGYFVTAVAQGQAAWEALAGTDCDFLCANDTNGDNVVTVGDIGLFVSVVTGQGSCQ